MKRRNFLTGITLVLAASATRAVAAEDVAVTHDYDEWIHITNNMPYAL